MDWLGKCEKCEGSGKIKTKGTPELRPYYKPNWVEVEVDCPACNGTGERDLTADEAAKIIADYLYIKYGINKVTVKRYSGQRNKKRVVLWRVETGICPDPFNGKGYEGYTEALNAAARAVRSKG